MEMNMVMITMIMITSIKPSIFPLGLSQRFFIDLFNALNV